MSEKNNKSSLVVIACVLSFGVEPRASSAFPAHSPKEARSSSRPELVAGKVWASNQLGYGQARPSTIYNGGDPTGRVEHIRWVDWGKAKAVGQGTAMYLGPNTTSVVDARNEPVTVVVWDICTCNGRRAYRNIEWFFPQHGQSFDATTYINMCTGDYASGKSDATRKKVQHTRPLAKRNHI